MNLESLLKIDFDTKIKSDPQTLLNKIDLHQEVQDVLLDEKHYFITAEVGYGKTSLLIELSNLLKCRSLIIFPLKANVLEFEEYCNQKGISVGVVRSLPMGASKVQRIKRDSEIREKLNEEDTYVFLSVYDNLRHFLRIAKLKCSDTNLIIDEYHNLVTSYRYRTNTIENIIMNSPVFRKIIRVSGTPEGTLDANSEYLKLYLFTNKNLYSKKESKLSIIKYKQGGTKKLLHHVVEANVDGKIIILINNKRLIMQFVKMLEKYLSVANRGARHISSLSSDSKDDSLFSEIANNKMIPDDVKYLITTSVIGEGMNILNEDISSIYMLDIDDWWLKRQFIGRFRCGASNIYDFLSYKYEYPRKWFSPKMMRRQLVSCAKSIARAKNKIDDIGFQSLQSSEINEIVRLDKDSNLEKWRSGTYKVNMCMIDINIIERLNKIMNFDPIRAREFYIKVAKFEDVDIVGYDSELMKQYNPRNYKQINSINSTELARSFYSLLNTHIYLTAPQRYSSKKFDRRIIARSADPIKFKSNYEHLLSAGHYLQNLMDQLSELAEQGYPTGYLEYLYNKKLGKPNLDLKKEIIYFDIMVIRDIKDYFQKMKISSKSDALLNRYRVIWQTSEQLEGMKFIEVERLKTMFQKINESNEIQNANLNDVFLIINGLFSSGKLQYRKGRTDKRSGKYNDPYYVKPIGSVKTFQNTYSSDEMDYHQYLTMCDDYFTEYLRIQKI